MSRISNVGRERASQEFERLIRDHYESHYAMLGEKIVAVWVTQRDELGNVLGFDIDTVPLRPHPRRHHADQRFTR